MSSRNADARNALDQLQHAFAAALEEPYAEASRCEGRMQQDLHEPAVEELDEPSRRFEEVERVLRGRRVDDDQVEIAPLRQFEDLLHRRVLGAARERVGDVLIDAVAEDALASFLGVGEARDQFVEGAFHVEHQRSEPSLGRHAQRGEALAREIGRLVAEFGDAERVGETARRVDRQHGRAAPEARAREREAGGERGLADATRADAHDDVAIAHQRDGVERRRSRRRLPRRRDERVRRAAASSSGPRTPRAMRGNTTSRSSVVSASTRIQRSFSSWRARRCAAHAASTRGDGAPGSARSAGRARQPRVEIVEAGRKGRGGHCVHDHAIDGDADLIAQPLDQFRRLARGQLLRERHGQQHRALRDRGSSPRPSRRGGAAGRRAPPIPPRAARRGT